MATLDIRAIEVNPIAMNVTAFFAVQEPVFALQFSLAGLLFGVLTTLTSFSIWLLLRRPSGHQWYWSIRIPLAGTILLYLSTSLYMAAFAWNRQSATRIVAEATDGLFSSTYDGKGRAAYEEAVLKQSWMATVALGANIVLGDAIVWWRACLIWRHKAVYWTGPILVVLTLGLAAIGSALNHPGTLMSVYFIFGADAFSTAGVALSLATNLAATALIAYKAWFHRRRLKRYLGGDNTQTRVMKVLVLLVESGSVYTTILILVIILQVQEHATNSDPGIYFLYGCLVPLVAMYPTVIIVLTAANSSPLEHGLSQISADSDESGPSGRWRERVPPIAVRLRRCTRCTYEESPNGKVTIGSWEQEAVEESREMEAPSVPKRRSDSIVDIV
ncbi:hypothetical protein V8D89_007563 [Ganoderma adspersum]